MTTMRPERCIKLTLAYDGTDFAGWQRQAGDRSVQETLEHALGKMHGRPLGVVGAGRTDAGVHAAGQVAHFHTDIASIAPERFLHALNKLLPRDVRVLASEEADPNFNARHDARLRRYKYFMYSGGAALPWKDRYAWRLPGRPDLAKLNRLAACLRGELDCTAFAAAKDPSPHRWRYLHHAVFYAEGDSLVFDVAANAFLWRMVRSLTGTLIGLERDGAPDRALKDILESGERARAGQTAPARGLFLWEVQYYGRHAAGVEPLPYGAGPAGGDKRLVPGLGWV